MPIFQADLKRPYFDQVVSGRKRVEVRVRHARWSELAPGERIRFACDDDVCLVTVVKVVVYPSFEELLDAEDADAVIPDTPRDQQLKQLRSIYGPDKEALGVLAIAIEADVPVQPDIH